MRKILLARRSRRVLAAAARGAQAGFARDLAVGAGLGAFLGLSVIVANPIVFNTMVVASSPRLAVLGFLCLTSTLIGIGCAITGFILKETADA